MDVKNESLSIEPNISDTRKIDALQIVSDRKIEKDKEFRSR